MSDIKKVSLSVQEFALPAPRTGSIESSSGYFDSMQKGIELHQLLQNRTQNNFPDYQKEVRIQYQFEKDGYLFKIDGRMDGIFPGEPASIEEIKSCFNIHEMKKVLKMKDFSHPYVLQLHTYGYFYWKNTGVVPNLILHLISSRTMEETDLYYELDVEKYESWLSKRLLELVEDAKRAEKRSLRRRSVAQDFPFPFPKPRKGQVELIAAIEEGMSEKAPMMLQAPTGLGKTAGVLYPSLKEALSRGQKVIYVTPKNSQQRVAEEAIEKFQEKGCQVKSLTLTAKSKLCMKAEPLCNPEYCEFARDHYDKLHKHGLKDQLMKKKKITSRVIKNMAEKYQVCPFELQLEAVEEMDTVICDYNYVFANRSALERTNGVAFDEVGKPNLVIDEAHNLPARSTDYYSPALSSYTLEKMRDEFKLLPKRYAETGKELLDEALSVIKSFAPKSGRSEKINLSLEPFLDLEEELKSFLSKYLDSDVEIKSRDVVLRFVFYWSEFTDILRDILGTQRPEFFISYHFEKSGGVIKITCCDASAMLKPRYENFDQVIAFSATLKPFTYYAELSGLKSERLLTAEFESPFEKSQRKILVIPQISTKYSERERNYQKIAETIRRVSELRPGNYLAFFPSFDFLEKTASFLHDLKGFNLIKQNRFMKNTEVEMVIEGLKENRPTIVLAVQGGHFSEGVDYPGEMVIGAFVIGPPLPNFDFERENIKQYFETSYQQGFDYAYTYPAMAKAVQSAGRVIRSETDKGIIILMDDRFLQNTYSKTMPQDWFHTTPQELVSQSILKDIQEFWRRSET